ncbi:MAG: hypothetical protein HY901_06975 [Deltaproteobacteria bacterium]|nr:hypothetical protein [Deltaproteobacteria bacterium]
MSKRKSGYVRPFIASAMVAELAACHCGPEPTTCEPRTCAALGAACGQAADGCGRTLECGVCAAPESCAGAGAANQCSAILPPDPSTVAPPLDPTVPTDFGGSLEFLYTGDNPIQPGVAPGTLDPSRVALIRGRARSADGSPLSGVAVEVLNHPELGSTVSRADGMFDLVVNGGGPVILRYRRSDRLEVQRRIHTPWRDVVWAPDVVLIAEDSALTALAVGAAEAQAAQATPVTDEDGQRRATLILGPGTTATLKMPDGARRPLDSMHVRLTEYTAGANGLQRMPGDLPPQSAYTYALELTVDEAREVGAVGVELSKPAALYVDNFLGYRVGGGAPAGSYDPQAGRWFAEPNGAIVRVIAATAGLAEMDTDGDGEADSPAVLAGQGIDEPERRQVAASLTAGQSYWRVPLEHFSAWDVNWAFACQKDGEGNAECVPPMIDQPWSRPTTCQAEYPGSIIRCQDQALGESIPVTGTPFRLVHWSDRADPSSHKMRIMLSGSTVAPSLTRIRLSVRIAGQTFDKELSPEPNLFHLFEWDGRDGYGRPVQGSQPVTILVGYVYRRVPVEPGEGTRFGDFSDAAITGDSSRNEIEIYRAWKGRLGSLRAGALGLGGWDLDVHHVYDPATRRLHFGSGGMLAAESLPLVIRAFAGTGVAGSDGDGGRAVEAALARPSGVAAAADGSVYIAEELSDTVRVVGPDGKIRPVVGPGSSNLLRNPSCEVRAGSGAPDWIGGWECATVAGEAYEGRGWFDASHAGLDGELFQDVDVSAFAETIAAGSQRFAFSGHVRDRNLHGRARLVVEYRGASGVLSAYDSGPIEPQERWSALADERVAPVGTEAIRVRMIALQSGSSAAMDALSLRAVGAAGGSGAPEVRSPRGLAVGSDGTLYIAGQARVWRRAPDGTLSVVAGTGEPGYSGDGGPAAGARLRMPWGLALDPSGNLYITDHEDHRLRRVTADGMISTVAGMGEPAYGGNGDGGPASQALLSHPEGVAVDAQGALYVASERRLRRIGPDGTISTFAGGGSEVLDSGGILATQASFCWVSGVAVDGEGAVLFTDGRDIYAGRQIYKVGHDGFLTVIAGAGRELEGDGLAANAAQLHVPQAIAVLPNGEVVFADREANRVRSLAPSLPGFSNSEITIASLDGASVHVFDRVGRHLRTLDAMTGAPLLEFGYDERGLLTSVSDRSGNRTRVERNAEGAPNAIVAPFGQRTSLALGADKLLQSVTNPMGDKVSMTYAQGRLARYTDARGGEHRFTYEEEGRLIKDEDPAGGSRSLTRIPTETGFAVELRTGLGRTTSHRMAFSKIGRTIWHDRGSAGAETVTVEEENWDRTVSYPDGSHSETKTGPDPRFWTQAPVARDFRYTLPSGLSLYGAQQRSVVYESGASPRLPTRFTESISASGDTFTSDYDGASRTLTYSSAEGRQVVLTLDEKGRVVAGEMEGFAQRSVSYDGRGRPTAVTNGTRHTTLVHDESGGWLASITDPMSRTITIQRDVLGRPEKVTLADGSVVKLGYDAGSNLTSVTSPGRASSYEYGYTPVDLESSFTPPAVEDWDPATRFTHDVDRALTRVERPDSQAIDIAYDASGRPEAIEHRKGRIELTYEPVAGRLVTAKAPEETLQLEYDGPLVTRVAWSGAVSGSVEYVYDRHLRIQRTRVNGEQSLERDYDGDGLLFFAGGCDLRRDERGLVTRGGCGRVLDDYEYDEYGEMTARLTRTPNQELLAVAYERDALGRITRKTEIAGDGAASRTTVWEYEYDAANRLAAVKKDGAEQARWGYDAAGNRTSEQKSGATITATFDAQDRLLTYGTTTYGWGRAGELEERRRHGEAPTSFVHDALGSLTSVRLSDGRRIEYVLDAAGRPVGKKVDGVLVAGWLWESELRIAAELDGAGNVVSQFAYGLSPNVPERVVKGERGYRIVTDHLGSPRLVVEQQTEEVVQAIEYDAWGNVVSDSNPGFQPFGFAGGLHDRDLGMVRFGRRFYDPETGRFIRQEPVLKRPAVVAAYALSGTALHPYSYAANNPMYYYDPDGRCFRTAFKKEFMFSFSKTNGLFFGFPMALSRTAMGAATAGTVASACGTTTALQAVKSAVSPGLMGPGMSAGVPTLGGVGATIGSAALTSVINGILVGASLEVGIAIGSAANGIGAGLADDSPCPGE